MDGDQIRIKGLVFAGSADFKNQLADSDILDARLRRLILRRVDVAFGGRRGLSEAIDLTRDLVLSREQNAVLIVLDDFANHCARDTGLAVFGEAAINQALEQGAVKTLLVTETRREQYREVIARAESQDGEIVVIPVVNDASKNFEVGFGGLAAIARWRIEFVEEDVQEPEDIDTADDVDPADFTA
jgi:peptide chain release factor subunit 1